MIRNVALACIALSLLGVPSLHASDHADPRKPPPARPEVNLSDLFVFPDGDRLVAALAFRPRTPTSPPPTFDFSGIEYAVNFDTQRNVTFDDRQDLLRYGGTVTNPETIAPTATIRFQLVKDHPQLAGPPVITGLRNPTAVLTYVSLRADPFIFPGLDCLNVVAFVASIPFDSFPPGTSTLLVWATSRLDGSQTDLVGRSIRSQLDRLDGLNLIPPSEHVKWIRAMPSPPIKPYDFAPDVLIFNRLRPVGFPNGRRLDEDVTGLVCNTGDCAAQEAAILIGGLPRRTTPSKPFDSRFPYLIAPHGVCPAEPDSDGR